MSGIRKQIRSSEELLDSIQANIASYDDLCAKIDRLHVDNENLTLSTMKLSESLTVSKLTSELFSSTGAPAYILDSAIALFNESIETYIDVIWPNASYKLLSYKENKDGSVVAKLSEELIINAQKRSIGSLSGGERRALSISIDLAVIDMLSKQFGIYMNPIVLDEPFDGLDNQGREVVVDLLARLATSHQVFVIDHVSESNASFTKTLRIEKKNGISSIVSML
jgi:DNA repair exonuclease SbcCD ATPase subunit